MDVVVIEIRLSIIAIVQSYVMSKSSAEHAVPAWRTYFSPELENRQKKGDRADRFEQYLDRFQGADVSVYVSDLIHDISSTICR